MITSARSGQIQNEDPYLLPKKMSEKFIKVGLENVKMEIPPSQNN